MAIYRTRTFAHLAAAAIAIAASAAGPSAMAGPDDRVSFCPAHDKLWGALCMNGSTGDIVRPETSGPDYAMRKAESMGPGFCASWDVHITTQIGDFGDSGTVPANRLERAGLLQNLARALCRDNRFAEGVDVYESIFAGVE
ncbi:MAG: hypothetical protein ACRCTI_16945 [Beijerinckiaceae bacterium]